MSKHELLREFTQVLHDKDPMGFNAHDQPEEYAPEALSILSRFTESMLHLCDDEQLQHEIALGLVNQAFHFWFNDPDFRVSTDVATALLSAYVRSYPSSEQKTDDEIPS